jgi:putative ABC transport system permease protein
MIAVGHDMRIALRSLRATPWFSGLVVIILTLATGINTGLYSVIYSALFRPLGVTNVEQLIYIYFKWDKGAFQYIPLSKDAFQAFAAQSHLFSEVAAHSSTFVRIAGPRGSQMIPTEVVTTNYFGLLGITPARGRTFTPSDDDVTQAETAAVISYDLWTKAFDGNPNVLGTRVRVSGNTETDTVTIVGIAPREFKGVSNPWTPTVMWMTFAGYYRANQGRYAAFAPIARVRPDVSVQTATEVVPAIGAQLGTSSRLPVDEHATFVAFPATRVRTPFDPSAILVPTRILIGLVVVALTVLLIAAVNVTGILMSRGVTRAREMATRTALGASPRRLARQLLIESLLLSIPAAAGSVIVGWGFVILVRTNAPQRYALDLRIDPGTILTALLVSTVMAILITITPALAALRLNLRAALGAPEDVATPNARSRLRHVVVVPQIALTLVLLVLAAVYARSVLSVYLADVGYGLRNVMVLSTERRTTAAAARNERPADASKRTQDYYQRLLHQFDSVAGAGAVALTTSLPLEPGNPSYLAAIHGIGQNSVSVTRTAVSPQYFRAMGVPLLAGRTFLDVDDRSRQGVAIVSRSVAMELCPGRDCVGELLALTNRFPATGETPQSLRIVGVVGDTRPVLQNTTLSKQVYLHLGQEYVMGARTAIARVGGASSETIQNIRQLITSADPLTDVIQARTLQQVVNDMLYVSRTAAGILGLAALIGLFFATVGLYAVMSYSVSQRVMEIGIRSALGAGPDDILWLILVEGGRVLMIGTAVGLVLARSAFPVVGRYVEMPRSDVASWTIVSLVLMMVVLAACYLPARRASRFDALSAIRHR